MEARKVIVRGRVQGVGFRWFVVRNAQALGVGGTVRNRADGAVEAIVTGERPADIETFIDRLRSGPPAARVEAVEIEPVDEPGTGTEEMRVIG